MTENKTSATTPFPTMTSLFLLPPPPPELLLSTATTVPLPPSYSPGHKMATVITPVSDASEPPTYSPSPAAPAYAIEPGPSERTLAATARAHRMSRTGVFMRSNSLITIALRGQQEDATLPSYGRNAKIAGDVGLSCTQGVQSVDVVVRIAPSLSPPPNLLAAIDCALLAGGPVELSQPRVCER